MITLGLYRHYKGNTYEVIGRGKLEATLEDMVIYKPTHPSTEFPQDMMRIRPLSVFTENIEHNGNIIPRFEYLGPLSS